MIGQDRKLLISISSQFFKAQLAMKSRTFWSVWHWFQETANELIQDNIDEVHYLLSSSAEKHTKPLVIA